MSSKETVRLNFEFPREEYPYLKMMCAAKGMTFRQLATNLLFEAIEEYEDKALGKEARKRLKEMDSKNTISFDKATKEAGWKDSDKI
jgi:predicted DNA-binding protein